MGALFEVFIPSSARSDSDAIAGAGLFAQGAGVKGLEGLKFENVSRGFQHLKTGAYAILGLYSRPEIAW